MSAAHLGAKRIVLSDFVAALLQNLSAAVEVNCKELLKERRIAVKHLDWSPTSDHDPEVQANEKFDMIFGTDILYERDFADWIPNVLTIYLLQRSRCREREQQDDVIDFSTAAGVFSCPTREISILSAFVNNLQTKLGMVVQVFSGIKACDNLTAHLLRSSRLEVTRESASSVRIHTDCDDNCLIILCWW